MRSARLQLILQGLAHLKWIPTQAPTQPQPRPNTINLKRFRGRSYHFIYQAFFDTMRKIYVRCYPGFNGISPSSLCQWYWPMFHKCCCGKLTSLRGLHPKEMKSSLSIMSVAVSKLTCSSRGHGCGGLDFRLVTQAWSHCQINKMFWAASWVLSSRSPLADTWSEGGLSLVQGQVVRVVSVTGWPGVREYIQLVEPHSRARWSQYVAINCYVRGVLPLGPSENMK